VRGLWPNVCRLCRRQRINDVVPGYIPPQNMHRSRPELMEGGQKGKDTFKDPLNEHFVHRYDCIIDVNMCRRCNKQDSVIELLSIRYMDVERGGNLRKVIALGRGRNC